MNRQNTTNRFSPQSILKNFYHRSIEKVIVPYSSEMADILERIRGIHSGSIQNVLYVSHNHVNMEIWRERLDDAGIKRISRLNAPQTERIFVQSVALRELALSQDFLYIDYSRFQLDKNHIIRFALRYDGQPDDSFETWLKILSSNDALRDLTADNYRDRFHSLRTGKTFLPKDLYWYHSEDLSSSLLVNNVVEGEKNRLPVRIRIQPANPVCESMFVLHLLNRWWSQNTVISILGGEGDIVDQVAGELSPELRSPSTDLAGIVTRWGEELNRRDIESVMLVVRPLQNRREVEFLNFLLDSPGLPRTFLFYLGSGDGIFSDAVMNDNPENRLGQYIRLGDGSPRALLKDDERFVIKIFKCISLPIPKNALSELLGQRESMGLNRLIKKNVLKESSGSLSRGLHFSSVDVSLNRSDWARIIKIFSKIVSSLYLDVCFFLENHRLDDLKVILRNYFSWNVRIDFLKGSDTFFDMLAPVKKDEALMKLLGDIFIRENHMDMARRLIRIPEGSESDFWKLKAAHVHLAERDLLSLEKILGEVSGGGQREYPDEFYYLRFCLWEKRGDPVRAGKYLSRISGRRWRHLSLLRMSDRYIRNGDWEEAEKIIDSAAAYFHPHHPRDFLAARTLLGKLRAFQGHFEDAQQTYKNAFIQCEIRNYKCDAGQIALGIGDLYWQRGRVEEARSWYRKAGVIFESTGDSSGKIQADERMADVNILRGDWILAQSVLQPHIAHFSSRGDDDSLAACNFRLSRLAFMRHNFQKAEAHLQKSLEYFSPEYCFFSWCDAKLLQMKILMMKDSDPSGSDLLHTEQNRMNISQRNEFLVLRQLKKNGDTAAFDDIMDRVGGILSGIARFELLVFLSLHLKTDGLREELMSLSGQLGGESRNYFFFEYRYVFYRDAYPGEEIGVQDLREFLNMYHFFDRNLRKMDPVIMMYKKLLDQRELNTDIFKSAELVENYRQWRIPNDFFVSFSSELRKELPFDFIKLVVFHRGERLFDFASSNLYRSMMDELVDKAAGGLDELDLNFEDLRNLVDSQEKALYPYVRTKVLLWRLSESLMGLLVLAFDDDGFQGYDIWARHGKFLKKFGTLIHRFFEDDYQRHHRLDFIVGESDAIRALKQKILKVSRVHFSLLITGESGSGKELVAKGVHLLSPRKENAFVPVNAAAIPENLLEAEMFGYRKGAFTGAAADKTGLIETASGGTLFLDEVADLPLKLQAKLLRVLQEQELRRLGENRTIPVDIRLISATNRDLENMISRDLFREDFFFRIQDLTLPVPPLRDRTEDIPMLVRHFMEKNEFPPDDYPGLHQVVFDFQQKSWKGNVRELESRVKRLITYFPETVETELDESAGTGGLVEARENLEKQLIRRVLNENSWNKVNTAKALKISRVYLFNLMKKYNIPIKNPRKS